MFDHQKENPFSSAVLVFFMVTTCVTILQGTMGAIFWPDSRVGYQAFLSPPLFGFLSALSGIVTYSRRELSMSQMAFRMFLQLVIIELMVFAANMLFGDWGAFTPVIIVALAIAIAIIYGIVWLGLWLNDRRTAREFNKYLLKFQGEQEKETIK